MARKTISQLKSNFTPAAMSENTKAASLYQLMADRSEQARKASYYQQLVNGNAVVQGMFNPNSYNSKKKKTQVSGSANQVRNLGGRHSEVLRESLLNIGVPDQSEEYNNQAHHIVEANDSSAEVARYILELVGIDIDSAINGVFLPSEHYVDMDITVHKGSHVKEYAHAVNQAIIDALSTSGVDLNTIGGRLRAREIILDVLKKIRELLLSNDIGLNKRNDTDYRPPDDSDDDEGTGGSGTGVFNSFQQGNLITTAYY